MSNLRQIAGVPFFPLLAALYPMLALADANRDQLLDLKALTLPTMVILAVTGASWAIAGFIDRRNSVRSLFTLLAVVFAFWYGPFERLLAFLLRDTNQPEYLTAFPAWILLAAIVFMLLWRKRPDSRSVTEYFNLFTAILIVFPLFGMARQEADLIDSTWIYDGVDLDRTRSISATNHPDIYLFILDKYTSGRSLSSVYDHDNRTFEQALRQRGFIVPSRSRTNYIHTHLSLASLLNYTHLHDVAARVGRRSSDRTETHRMIENNRVVRFLQRRGYRFIFFGTSYVTTFENELADVQVPARSERYLNFAFAWLRQTSVIATIDLACHFLRCLPEERQFPYPPETFEQQTLKFERLARVAPLPGPKFVFAHVLVPHEPFLFREDCSPREMVWPSNADPSTFPRIRDLYTQQVECLNRMLLGLVDSLLAESSNPPVILLQSDHGHGRMDIDPIVNRVIPFEELNSVQVQERIEVFSAYYLPGESPPDVPDDVTPVNLFPIVFNRYFDAGIPERPNQTYWSEPRSPFDFRLVDPESME